MCSHLSSLTISLGALKVGAVSFPAGRVVCKGWTRSLETSLEIPAFKKIKPKHTKLLIINFLSKFKTCFHSASIYSCLLSHPAAIQLPELECFPWFKGVACCCTRRVRAVVSAPSCLRAWPARKPRLLFSDGSQCFTHSLRLDNNNLRPLY